MIEDQVASFRVLGVKVNNTNIQEVLSVMDGWVKKRGLCNFVVATGMHGTIVAHKDPYFMEITEAAGLFIPDGYSLVAAAKLRGLDIKGRITGCDLMWEACRHAEHMGYSVFFYGDTAVTLDSLANKLLQQFPSLKIAGLHSPPFRPLTQEEDDSEVDMINNSGADIIWVGLGLPKQERWIYEHRDRLNVPIAIGVGAAFKFLSGQVRRAPALIGNNGFEWLWRLVVEPRRVWRRVLIDGPHFVVCMLRETLDSHWLGKTK